VAQGHLRVLVLLCQAHAAGVRLARGDDDETGAAAALLGAVGALEGARAAADAVRRLRATLTDGQAGVPGVWGPLEPAPCASLRVALARSHVLSAAGRHEEAARVVEAALISTRSAVPALLAEARHQLGRILERRLSLPAAAAAVCAVGRARDVVLVLDRSGSMAGGLGSRSAALSEALLGSLGPADRFAALVCAEGTRRVVGLGALGPAELRGSRAARAREALRGLPTPTGRSSVLAGVDEAAAMLVAEPRAGGQAGRRAVVVVVTDGLDNGSPQGDRHAAERALARGAPLARLAVIVAVLGAGGPGRRLEALAEASSGGSCLVGPTDDDVIRAVEAASSEERSPETSLEAY